MRINAKKKDFCEQINARFNVDSINRLFAKTHIISPQKFLPKNNIFRLNLNLKSIENFCVSIAKVCEPPHMFE